MLQTTYPISLLCEVVGLARSSDYYHCQDVTDEDEALAQAIQTVLLEWPTYGYRRVTAQLQREGQHANSKRVRRLMQELGLAGRAPQRRLQTTDSEHPFGRYPNLVKGHRISAPDEVWVGDITYIALRDSFVYLAVLMDVYTRMIRGWELSRALDQALTLTALERALVNGAPKIHHSDQGVQYAATAYVACLSHHGVSISMASVGKPEENGYAERLMRTIKEEEVHLSEYQSFEDAYRQIGRFLDDVYSHKRIHSALGYLTPAEFQQQWIENQLPGSSP
jgi:transposase InsO family protein